MSDLCADCTYMRKDAELRARCYSPQLVKLRLGGILVNFERDATPEPDRSRDDGTGKCGPLRFNFKKKDGV